MTPLEKLERLGRPVFFARDARAAGVSWHDLYALRDEGIILELSRGLYQLASHEGFGHLDFVVVCARAPHATVATWSAASYWNLTDLIPRTVHIAVAEGRHRPKIDYPPTTVHVFAAATFELGRTEVDDYGARYWITDRERTVVDLFRMRYLLGEDYAYAALRAYVYDTRPTRYDILLDYADKLRTQPPLMYALRILG